MDPTTAGIILVTLSVCGIVAGGIAYGRVPTGGTFVAYFFVGLVLGLLGVLLTALFVKPVPAAPQPPGWYPDPWRLSVWRWYDGAAWTWNVDSGQPA